MHALKAQSHKVCVCLITGDKQCKHIDFRLEQFDPGFVQCEHANFTQE